jgi:NTP pyrophosphatase (non-canonical NTP hydrolase)
MTLQELILAVEQVSRRYAAAYGIQRSEDWAVMKISEEVGEMVRMHLKRTGQARVSASEAATLRLEFENELADVLGQVLVLASVAGVDLSAALERKWLRWHPDRLSDADYDKSRPA